MDLANRKTSVPKSTPAAALVLEPFVDAVRAGEFLSLSPRRVLELARQGILPGCPLGQGIRKVWRFRLSELAAALSSPGVDCPRQSPAPGQETF
jgi:hypothetical protein